MIIERKYESVKLIYFYENYSFVYLFIFFSKKKKILNIFCDTELNNLKLEKKINAMIT